MRPLASILLLSCLLGCSSTLDTGYAPRKLNASSDQRRAYYAPEYSPQSQVKTDQDEDIAARRPKPGY